MMDELRVRLNARPVLLGAPDRGRLPPPSPAAAAATREAATAATAARSISRRPPLRLCVALFGVLGDVLDDEWGLASPLNRSHARRMLQVRSRHEQMRVVCLVPSIVVGSGEVRNGARAGRHGRRDRHRRLVR